VKSWASSLVGGSRRDTLLRAGLAVVLVGALVWFLPVRRPAEEGGHHAGHPPPALDPFERAGVSELKDGQRGPRFVLSTLDGRRAALDDYASTLVILNFWATWCRPCTDEMPTLEALWRQYRGRGLVVLGVSVDRGAPPALIDPYVKHLALTFPILLDPDMATATAWGVSGIPATFVVRPGGEVAGVAVGPREWNGDAMRGLVERLLPRAHGHE
jgi:peroxiredoxin